MTVICIILALLIQSVAAVLIFRKYLLAQASVQSDLHQLIIGIDEQVAQVALISKYQVTKMEELRQDQNQIMAILLEAKQEKTAEATEIAKTDEVSESVPNGMSVKAILSATSHVQRIIDLNELQSAVGKVTPFVLAAKSLEMTGNQKRMQVILSCLKVHPGMSVDTVDAAIENVLSIDVNGN